MVHKWSYRLHVWLGVLAGLIFFLISVSGCVAMFRMEIVQWHQSRLGDTVTVGDCTVDADQAMRELSEKLQGSPPRRLSLPALTGGYYELRLVDGRRLMLHACTANILAQTAGIGDYLVNLHTRLFLGKAGRWVVGSLGLLMFLSTLSGLVAHRKLFTQFGSSLLQMRWRGHSRRRLSDAHKLLGLWLIPFHLMIAGTGAWLGLITFVDIGGVDRGGGQAQQQIAQASPFTQAPALEPLLAIAQQTLPDLTPVFIDFFPDKGQVSIRGNIGNALVRRHSAEVLFDASQGAVLSVYDPRQLKTASWLAQAVMPLHVGDWRGLGVKVIYVVLGLGTTVMIALGLWLWGNRRLQSAGIVIPAGTQARDALVASLLVMVLVSCLPILLTGQLGRIYASLAWPEFFAALIASSLVVYAGLRLWRCRTQRRIIANGAAKLQTH
ncbi:MAG: PepSY-associated TM helix domain-containing protein [Cellvibrionaceae bacterium]